MSTTTTAADRAGSFARLLDEGHSTRAWYGADILSAVGDLDADTAARRPAPGRHNIGEIALHHAYWAHEVRHRLTGDAGTPFPFTGEDWFEWPREGGPSWSAVQQTLHAEVHALYDAVRGVEAGTIASPLAPAAQVDQILGIAAHAAYHAGQVQLVKRLVAPA
jgi:hypothetical protein